MCFRAVGALVIFTAVNWASGFSASTNAFSSFSVASLDIGVVVGGGGPSSSSIRVVTGLGFLIVLTGFEAVVVYVFLYLGRALLYSPLQPESLYPSAS